MRLLAAAFILSIGTQSVTAQNFPTTEKAARDSSRIFLAITAGYVTPKSKEPLTKFWKGGPGVAIAFMVRATPALSFGVGGDVSALWFRRSNFGAAYPSVEVRPANMAWMNLFMRTRYAFLSDGPVRPYAECSIGASRLSGAEYKEIIDSVRVTYYDIPARTRLAVGLAGGVEIPVSRSVSFLAEGTVRYVHNDPNLGVGLGAWGGVMVKL